MSSHDILFTSHQKSKKNKGVEYQRSKKKQLEPKIIKNILHCILGCDTTSCLHGIGKRLSIKKLRENQEFEKVLKVFLKDEVLPNEIIENGEKALLILYNSKGVNSLNVLCHQRFLNKVAMHLIPLHYL